MTDFRLLDWKREATDGPTAYSMRHDTRKWRREKGRAGHRFSFVRLKNIWVADDIHAVCNHDDDASWLYFRRLPLKGWLLISWHRTRREAQAAADLPLPDLTPKPKPIVAGIHIKAGWNKGDYTMNIACRTEYTADVITDIFQRMGCETEREMVA